MSITTLELIESWPGLKPMIRRALLSAVATRGKNKGFLKATAPGFRKDPLGNLAWNMIQFYNCPMRVSTSAIIMHSAVMGNSEETRLLLKEALEDVRLLIPDSLNKVPGVLIPLGGAIKVVEPALRWNMFGLRRDLTKGRDRIKAAILAANKGEV